MTTIEQERLADITRTLAHPWIITDALEGDVDYADAILTARKIRRIERDNTEEEINQMNLLCDVW